MKFRLSVMKLMLLCAVCGLATRVVAQQTAIYPVPQQISWQNAKAFDRTAAYTLTGAAEADADAVRVLTQHFPVDNGTVKLVIGEKGDVAVQGYVDRIPQRAEGYYLKVTPDSVVIAGADGAGTFYGVQTYLQIASQPEVMQVEVTDYPSVVERGLVEGYYGNPYTEANRLSLFEFFGQQKMNIYIYGPKDDAYHKSKWREEYPKALGDKIHEYVVEARKNKVDFVWAIHPGNDIQWNNTDRVNIVKKLKAMYALGVRTFAVFFDDVWGGEGTRGDKQAELMNYIKTELDKAYDDVNDLILCPTQYNKGWSNGNYLSTLGTTMDPSVRIMWTGNSVVDMINKGDMTWINNQIKRKAFIWLNYPVTDYCINHMLMGPTYGNDLDIADMLSGFTSNPMEYAEASKLSLYSIADYNWNMPAYDSDASWESAIAYLMPKNREAFHFFCENNVDLGPNTHGLRRENESPQFVAMKKEFDAWVKKDSLLKANALLAEHFTKFQTVADQLIATDEAPALVEELTPWFKVMKLVGQRGECVVDMQNALLVENPDSFIQSYLRYAQYEEEQGKIWSRDFPGSLKKAAPAVASLYVEPFIKQRMNALVGEYKAKYDYRLDVFPAQVVENGTYYIMVDGKYLTNANPKVNGSVPRFESRLDTIRPQKQEWRIAIDPETDRYKIVNVEDDRYLNENGQFSANASTNPYEAVWHTYNILRLANGKYAVQCAGRAGDKYWQVAGNPQRIQKSNSNAAVPANFIFDIVPVAGMDSVTVLTDEDVFYVMNGGRYLTNVNVKGKGGAPVFKEVVEPGIAQEWNFVRDAKADNLYKITSNADKRYIKENGEFGVNPYYSNWNTYFITMCAGNFSIQNTQEAGTNYWNVKGDRIDCNVSQNRGESYVFTIIKKDVPSSIASEVVSPIVVEVRDGLLQVDDVEVDGISLYTLDGRRVASAEGHALPLFNVLPDSYIAVATKGNQRYVSKVRVAE